MNRTYFRRDWQRRLSSAQSGQAPTPKTKPESLRDVAGSAGADCPADTDTDFPAGRHMGSPTAIRNPFLVGGRHLARSQGSS
jgi:hypothetical protein